MEENIVYQPVPPTIPVPPQPPKKNKLMTVVLLLIVILLICGGLVYVGIILGKKNITPDSLLNKPKACTQEAQVCPDGSSVGRIGPNCEFAPCPNRVPSVTSTPNETANWKTYMNTEYGFSFKYPNNKAVDIRKDAYLGVCNVKNGVIRIVLYPEGTTIPPIPVDGLYEMQFDVDIEQNQENLSVQDWVSQNCKGTWLVGAKQESIQVANTQAVKLIGVGEMMGIPEKQPMIIFMKSDSLYLLHPYVTTGKMETVDQILSTFKFTQ